MNKKRNIRRRFFTFARLLHIYISTFLFGLLVFFCLTGITLNHRWYGDSDKSDHKTILLSDIQIMEWGLDKKNNWKPELSKINNYFNLAHGFPHAHRIDIDDANKELHFDFKVPAGFANAVIQASDKTLHLEREQGGFLSIVNALHKGRYSGKTWFWIIDISAIVMMIFSITGIIILFHGKKHRIGGSILTILGIATPFFLYLLFVPNVGL